MRHESKLLLAIFTFIILSGISFAGANHTILNPSFETYQNDSSNGRNNPNGYLIPAEWWYGNGGNPVEGDGAEWDFGDVINLTYYQDGIASLSNNDTGEKILNQLVFNASAANISFYANPNNTDAGSRFCAKNITDDYTQCIDIYNDYSFNCAGGGGYIGFNSCESEDAGDGWYKYTVETKGWTENFFDLIIVIFGSTDENDEPNMTYFDNFSMIYYSAPPSDITNPNVTITSPANTTYNVSNITLTFTATDLNPVTCKRELNGVNTSIPGCQNQTFLGIEGDNNIKVYSTDSSNNTGRDSVNFHVAIPNFSLSFVSPTPADASVYNHDFAFINVTLSGSSTPDTCSLEWNYVNESMLLDAGGGFCYKNVTSLTEALHSYRVFANITTGEINVTNTQTLISNPSAPFLSIQNPANTTYNITLFSLNYTASDPSLAGCWYLNTTGGNNSLFACENDTYYVVTDGKQYIEVCAIDISETICANVSYYRNSTAPTPPVPPPIPVEKLNSLLVIIFGIILIVFILKEFRADSELTMQKLFMFIIMGIIFLIAIASLI